VLAFHTSPCPFRLGASVERRTRYDDPEDPIYYVVMHDPEGNEFCIS
jgi:Glyoxalase-like domain